MYFSARSFDFPYVEMGLHLFLSEKVSPFSVGPAAAILEAKMNRWSDVSVSRHVSMRFFVPSKFIR